GSEKVGDASVADAAGAPGFLSLNSSTTVQVTGSLTVFLAPFAITAFRLRVTLPGAAVAATCAASARAAKAAVRARAVREMAERMRAGRKRRTFDLPQEDRNRAVLEAGLPLIGMEGWALRTIDESAPAARWPLGLLGTA